MCMVLRMDIDRLQEIDARAYKAGLTLTSLAVQASVSSRTMAKLRRDPGSVRPRVITKLEAKLAELEASNAR